jgi:alcohol dehydrogenase (cytochrome c)
MRARLVVLMLLGSAIASAQVGPERLRNAAREAGSWLTYSGDYASRRFSPLTEIDPRNVRRLAVKWIYQTGVLGKLETTPLFIDGVLYGTGPDNVAFALDPRSGRPLWRYQRNLPAKVNVCCGRVNRGFAALGERLFLATLDAHVVALDARTGQLVWDVEAADYRTGYSFTMAPLAIGDKVIVGVAGGEWGTRGFIDAYEAATGRRLWRFYTIPGPGEPGHESWSGDSWQVGGTPAWMTGSYDPELGLLYWPTGNPAPSNSGAGRHGDNLYSNSMLALEVETGRLRWHYQFTPFDLHDWDATQIPVLLDAPIDGRPRRLLVQANRNGFYYVLDRVTGELLRTRPYARVTWAKEIGKDGRPVVRSESDPSPEGTHTCPGAAGATNWMSPAFSPKAGLFYVAAREQCDVFTTSAEINRPGRPWIGSVYVPAAEEKDWGAVRALDPLTGELRWEFKHFSAPWAGVLATAGGLVFSGDQEGYVIALDAATGEERWHFQTGAAIYAAPMTYRLDGRQHVVIGSGSTLLDFALPDPIGPVKPKR